MRGTQHVHDFPANFILQILSAQVLPAAAETRVRALLAAAGLSPEKLAQPDLRLPVSWIEPVLGSGELPLALTAARLGQQIHLTTHGLPSLLLLTAPTLRDAVAVCRYIPLLTLAGSLRVLEAGDSVLLFVNTHSGSAAVDECIAFYAMTAVHRLLTLLVGDDGGALLYMRGPRPTDFEQLPDINPAQWHFRAPANCLIAPRTYLDRANRYADPATFEVTRRACEAALEKQHLGVVERVRKILEDATDFPRQEDVAQRLNMATSTLKRHLAEQGSSFNELLRDQKRERAISLLLGTTLSCQEIAFRLGFSSQTNFTHAFKKWVGLAPSAFRGQE